jgi:hypothetical protein
MAKPKIRHPQRRVEDREEKVKKRKRTHVEVETLEKAVEELVSRIR